MSKADFVRGFSAKTKAAEIVAVAASRGMKLSARHVYVIRSQDARKRLGKAIAAQRPVVGVNYDRLGKAAPAPMNSDRVGQLRELIGELGTHAVAQELASFKTRVGA
jgi:hypothetical protein